MPSEATTDPIPESINIAPQIAPELGPIVVTRETGRPAFRRIDMRGSAITIIAILAVLMFLQLASHFVIPFIIAILLTYSLSPVVNFLEKWRYPRLPRWVGAFITLILVVGACTLAIYSLRDQAQAIVDQIPKVVRTMSRMSDGVGSDDPAALSKIRIATEALQKATDEATGTSGNPGPRAAEGIHIQAYAMAGGVGVLAFLGQAVMVLFLTYFLLSAGDKFKRKFIKMAGNTLTQKKISVQMFDAINVSIRRYMGMLLVTNLLVALATWAAFRMLGLNNAGTWAIAAGVLHLVPYFGPLMIATLTGGAAFLQFGTVQMALIVSGASLFIASLIGTVLQTWMAGRIAKMNTVAVFVALLFFGWLWGVWGVLLSVPIVVIIKVVADHVEGMEAFAEFLGD